MKNTLVATLFTILLSSPLLVSANNDEIFEGQYLNVTNRIEQDISDQDILNIESNTIAKPSDLNQWGSHWGSKIPFKANVPHDVVAYGVDIKSYFPKF